MTMFIIFLKILDLSIWSGWGLPSKFLSQPNPLSQAPVIARDLGQTGLNHDMKEGGFCKHATPLNDDATAGCASKL